MSHVDKLYNLGEAPYGHYEKDGCTYAYTFDERLQQARARGRDDGWESAWEIVTGGTAVELPWPERLRLVKRICEATGIDWADTGTSLIVYLGESISNEDRKATTLALPDAVRDLR